MDIRDKLYGTSNKLSISETNTIDHIFTIKITSTNYSWSHIFVNIEQLEELRDYINSKLERSKE